MKKVLLFSAVVLAFSAAVAKAQAPDYNYFDASYEWVHTDSDQIGDSNGLDTKLSLGLIDYLAFEGGYNYHFFDIDDPTNASADADAHRFTYGLVGYYPVCEYFHLLGRVGGLHDIIRFNNELSDEDNDGVYAGAGVRYLLENEVELEGNITYEHVAGTSAYWEYEGAFIYPLAESVGLRGSVALSNDSDVILQGGLRFLF